MCLLLQRGLINAVSGSLIRAPDFKDPSDALRVELIAVAELVSTYDAEFILKVHVHSRLHRIQYMNIRMHVERFSIRSSLIHVYSFGSLMFDC